MSFFLCRSWVQIWPKFFSLYPHPMKLDGGMYTGFILSVCLSVCLSVDNMVFRVCFGISTSNFMCMFIVAIGRKSHCFSATSVSKWPPGGHIGFFGFRTLTSVWLWISTPSFSSKILVYMGIDFQWQSFSKWLPGSHIGFFICILCRWWFLEHNSSLLWNFSFKFRVLVAVGRNILFFSDITFKMAAWWSCWIFSCDQAVLRTLLSICPSITQFPDCYSRLNSHMVTKWCTKLDVPSIKFQGHTVKEIDFNPSCMFLDCNSSLKSPMALK